MRDDLPTLFDRLETSENVNDACYSGLAGVVMKRGHAILEKPFSPRSRYPRVIEIGAGHALHLPYIKHEFAEYCIADNSPYMLELAKKACSTNMMRPLTEKKKLSFTLLDQGPLPFPDASFDRLVACHVLEHIVHPHEALRDWHRILKPGGVLSLILPCDPGVAWRLGRYVGTLPKYKKHMREDEYYYLVAREHVNSINSLAALVRFYFGQYKETWWPFRIPSMDINLIYAVNIWKTGNAADTAPAA